MFTGEMRWLVVLITLQALYVQGSLATKVLTIPGDVMLGGLIPVHLTSTTSENACGTMDRQPGFQYLAAMLFALEQINNSSTLLPNITLGTKIYDTCRSRTIGADRARDIIKETLLKNSIPLVGVVGPLVSDVSIATVQLLRVFGLPQVSYGSTSPDLSNKDLYGSFFRTVPPDSFQGQALTDILEHYGWTYIITINSKGNWGESGMRELEQAAEQRGICIAASYTLHRSPNVEEYDYVMKDILGVKYNSANVIVLFTTQTDSAGILNAAQRRDATRFTWVGSNGWSQRMTVTNGNELVSNGAITISHMEGQVNGFKEYFETMTPQSTKLNPWFGEFWESELRCNLHGTSSFTVNCTSDMVLPNMEIAPVRVVVNAVYAFAHALHDMQSALCPGMSGLCDVMKGQLSREKLVYYLRNVSFPDSSYDRFVRFNGNQEVDGSYSIMNFKGKEGHGMYVNVGSWQAKPIVEGGNQSNNHERLSVDSSKIILGNNKTEPSLSICSAACPFPQIRKRRETNYKCCWDCIDCLSHQLAMNDTCQSCSKGYRPDANRSSCILLPVVFPNLTEPAAIPFILFSCIGIMLTLAVGVFFVKFKEHAVIKAAGKELSAVILVGIFFCYAAIFPLLVRPSPISCAIARFASSVCYTTCYAPLFMKTNRIYRIFNRAQKAVSRPHFISPKSQVFITMGLIAVQILLTAVWTISSLPRADPKYELFQRTVLECSNEGRMLVLNVIYNLLLMLACTLFAFKTRNFPRNFNEAKYIGIMMYLTCAVWIIYLPSYLNTSNTFTKVYFNCGVSILNGTITLFGLFGPKVYVIFCRCKEVGSVAPGSLAPPSSREFARIQATQTHCPALESRRTHHDARLSPSVHDTYSQHVSVDTPRNSLSVLSTASNYNGSTLSFSLLQGQCSTEMERTASVNHSVPKVLSKSLVLDATTLDDKQGSSSLAKASQPIKINVTSKEDNYL